MHMDTFLLAHCKDIHLSLSPSSTRFFQRHPGQNPLGLEGSYFSRRSGHHHWRHCQDWNPDDTKTSSRLKTLGLNMAYININPEKWILGFDESVLWSMESIARTGSTLEALKSICQQAGATFLGAGAIIHNRLHGKTWEGDLETLAQVGSGGWGWDGERQLLKRKKKTDDAQESSLVMSWIPLRVDCYLLASFSPSAQVSPPSDGTGRAVDISPAVNDLALPEVVAADVLTERVMNEGKVLPGNLLKVYSFINHQVGDPLLWRPSPQDQDRSLSTLNRNWCLQTGEFLQRLGFEGNEIPAVALVLPIVALNRWIPAWWTCVGNCWLVSLLALAFRRFWRHRLEVYPQHMQSLGVTFILSSNFLIASFTFRTKTFRSVEAAWNCTNHICTVLSIPTS